MRTPVLRWEKRHTQAHSIFFMYIYVYTNTGANKVAGGPSRIEKAKIGLIQFHLSAPKTDMENNVVVSDYAAMDRILREERKYILNLVKKVSRWDGYDLILMLKSAAQVC